MGVKLKINKSGVCDIKLTYKYTPGLRLKVTLADRTELYFREARHGDRVWDIQLILDTDLVQANDVQRLFVRSKRTNTPKEDLADPSMPDMHDIFNVAANPPIEYYVVDTIWSEHALALGRPLFVWRYVYGSGSGVSREPECATVVSVELVNVPGAP